MSSACNGLSVGNGNCTTGNKPAYAGMNQGGGTVYSPFTTIRTGGGVSLGGSSQWTQSPANSAAAKPFNDPMAGMGQPPAPSGLPSVPVPGGVIDGRDTPVVLTPGNYYAASNGGCPPSCNATGHAITIKGDVRFAACSSCQAGEGFGKYVFFGGIQSEGNGANVTVDPGEYILQARNGAVTTLGIFWTPALTST